MQTISSVMQEVRQTTKIFKYLQNFKDFHEYETLQAMQHKISNILIFLGQQASSLFTIKIAKITVCGINNN